jgi:microcystin-dependent protein
MDNGSTVPNANGGFVDAGGGAASRIPGTEAGTLGGSAGSPDNTLEVRNLPDHEHSMRPPGTTVQFAAVKVDSAVVPGVSPGPGFGPTAPGQAQYLNSSGGVKTSATLATPFSVLNPYLTINYIIRSGPPAF